MWTEALTLSIHLYHEVSDAFNECHLCKSWMLQCMCTVADILHVWIALFVEPKEEMNN